MNPLSGQNNRKRELKTLEGSRRLKSFDAYLNDLKFYHEEITRTEKRSFEAQLSYLRSTINTQAAAFKKQAEEKDQSIKNLMEEVKEKTKKIEASKNSIQNLEAQLKIREGIETGFNAKIKEYGFAINGLQLACDSYEKEIRELKAQLAVSEQIQNELWASSNSDTTKLSHLQESCDNYEKKNKELEEQLVATEKNEAELCVKIKMLEGKNEGDGRIINDLKNEMILSKKYQAELEAKIEKMQNDHKIIMNLISGN